MQAVLNIGKEVDFNLHISNIAGNLKAVNCIFYTPQLFAHSVEQKSIGLKSPELEVTCGTVAIIIRVVLLSPYLCIRGVSLSSIH